MNVVMCMLSKTNLTKGEYFSWSCHLDYKQTMSRDFTNRVCFIFFSIITFSYRLLNALYVLPWLFGDKSVKSANIILSITILSSTVHARVACPLPSREVATLSSFICAQIFFQYELNLYRSNFHLIEYVFFQCNIWFTSTTT